MAVSEARVCQGFSQRLEMCARRQPGRCPRSGRGLSADRACRRRPHRHPARALLSVLCVCVCVWVANAASTAYSVAAAVQIPSTGAPRNPGGGILIKPPTPHGGSRADQLVSRQWRKRWEAGVRMRVAALGTVGALARVLPQEWGALDAKTLSRLHRRPRWGTGHRSRRCQRRRPREIGEDPKATNAKTQERALRTDWFRGRWGAHASQRLTSAEESRQVLAWCSMHVTGIAPGLQLVSFRVPPVHRTCSSRSTKGEGQPGPGPRSRSTRLLHRRRLGPTACLCSPTARRM